ncbi:MAG: gluconeogenesis factor YvcK family protein [Acidimicrobiales bacterium]
MSRPRVVALGGGHGLATTLRAARRYAGEVAAVVSVADDGGSSGRLRQICDIPAPGDARRCLVALGDPESLWARLFEHRFEAGDLHGHALGNLVIAGLTAVTGDLTAALAESGRLVGCVGRVLPATEVAVTLEADAAGGPVEGQVRVAGTGHIRSVWLVPPDAPATPEAVAAIEGADQVVLGPGSLFTSVLAAALVGGIRAALAATAARVVYVANLAPQRHETAGFDLGDHVAALRRHGVRADVVLRHAGSLPLGEVDLPVVERSVADDDGVAHDPARLADALVDLVG